MFTLTIDTDNAAFEHGPRQEVGRILREVAQSLKAGDTEGRIRDVNGNTVGSFSLTDK